MNVTLDVGWFRDLFFIIMNDLRIFENKEFGEVRVEMQNGEPMFCLADVCRVLDLRASDVRQRLGDDVVSTHTILDNLGRKQTANFVNEDGLYDVVLDSRKPEAKQFRKWVTKEVLPSIRKTGGYSVQKQIEPTTSDAILWINSISEALGLNNQSKLLLYKQWGESKGLPTPDYVTSKDVLLSATELLKRNEVKVSARVFNVAMTEKGLLEKKTRPSSKGEKSFNHLTEKGLIYGENQVSPSNPKETQPLYYENKFRELLTEIGLK